MGSRPTDKKSREALSQLVGRLREKKKERPAPSTGDDGGSPAPPPAAARRAQRTAAEKLHDLPRAPRDRELPLSYSQERLWFLDRRTPGEPWYNLPAALRLTGRLDRGALVAALSEIVRRHEALRTVFAEGEDGPIQVILPPVPVDLPEADLSRVAPRHREEAALDATRDEILRPFDLAAGPLVRPLLLRLGDEQHILVVTFHHIVSDGWSNGVFLSELAQLYGAFEAGADSPLPELPVQYPDYAVWQRERFSGDELDRLLDHWRERLAGAPDLLELPLDHPRPPVPTRRGAQVRAPLPAADVEPLRELARGRGATLFMGLLATLGALLHRLTGATDLVIGSPVAGRVHPKLEGLIGFFVNTLPLRLEPTGDTSFVELLDQARDRSYDAFEHDEVPFAKLVDELGIRRASGHNPLFQVALALQNAPAPGGRTVDLELEGVALPAATSKFDLTFAFVESADGGLLASLELDLDLFEPATGERFLARFGRLLAAAAAAPETALGDLPILTGPERRRQLEDWNDTARPYPRDRSVTEIFRRMVAEHPDRLAVEYPAAEGGSFETLTYAELARRADRLAARLAARGVRPGDPVILAMERSVDLVVATVAIASLGAWYLPLDPSYPDERLRFMLDDSGARALVGRRRGATELTDRLAKLTTAGGERLEVVWVDAPGDDGAPDGAPPAPPTEVSGDHLLYVMYTSGSTGKPKGVAIPHRAVARLVRGTDYVRFQPGDRIGQVANASFDAATFEIWGPLLNGGAVVGISPRDGFAPDRLARWISDRRIDSMFLTSALFDRMAVERPDAFARMRELLVGGDAVDPTSVRTVLESGGPERLINGYGPTESTTFAVWHHIGSVAPDATAVPIGRPLANTRVYLADARGHLVPQGVVGELLIAGDGLAHGYLRRPALTAERFVPDPFSPTPGGRLYRTGDLARFHPDGVVDCLGRIDHQVKVRGFRIEPGEVEAALGALDGVRDAAVVAWNDPRSGRTELVAYLVPSSEAGDDPAAVARRQLAKSLPEFMVPALLLVVDELPLNPNGKIDRRALAARDPLTQIGSAAGDGGTRTAPRTESEKRLAPLWSRVLGVDEIGVDDDFFALGGHSLLATRLVSAIRRELGLELPLEQIFEHPTVAGVAAWLDAAGGDGVDSLPAIRPRPSTSEAVPLSFAQERLWFLDRFDPGSPAYNIPAALRLEGRLAVATLAQSLVEIVRRHEILRARFGTRDDQVVQTIPPACPPELPVVDLSAVIGGPVEADDPRIERLARREAARPFDLERGPLLRASLLRLTPFDHVFLVTFHHIVSDGWSTGLFVAELAELYRARLAGRMPELPELPVQYPDFALWQREWLAGDQLERQLLYWRRQLADAPEVVDLPTDRPRPSVATAQGRRHPIRLDAELTGALRQLAQAEGTTLFVVLLAAFGVLLHRSGAQEDLVVGAPIANRTRSEIENLIGLFVNTLALRLDLAGEPTFRELLGRVRQTTTQAYSHQDLPFEKLVAEIQPHRSRSHSPIFQVMLSFNDAGMSRLELPELTLSGVTTRGATAKFDLTLALSETPDGLAGILGYRAALFDPETIERLGEHLEHLLRDALAHPDRSIHRLELLPDGERRRLVESLGRTAPLGVAEPAIHRLVEAQAAREPAAVALVLPAEATGGDRLELTYGDLDRRAGELARRLAAAGAGPGARVALCLDRSFEQIVAVFATLKTGAAYVPLDTGFPAERLSFMAADSSPVVLVTTGEHAGAFAASLDACRILRIDDQAAAGSDGAAAEPFTPATPARPDDAAYVIYTSGSTGRPKGVVVSHRSLAERLAAIRRLFDFGAGDRQLQFASLSFDLSCDELFLTLTSGATLVLEPRPAALRPPELLDLCEREGITKLSLTSSHWHQIIDEMVSSQRRLPESLRILCTGAESPSADRFAELARRAAPAARLFNFYGPTEATISATQMLLPAEPERLAAFDRVPIGRPFAGVRVHILDALGQTVPIGVPGEIVVGGSGIAIGYLGRPAQTAERFVPDPWSTTAGGRLYRTGDLARFRTDGALEFLGRADSQVKVRGFRIELGEVEETLRDHEGVADVAVAVRTDTGEPRLVAYLVPSDPAAAPTASALRRHLAERLPEFMVPSLFVPLDELPATPTGKLDRDALPAPSGERPDLAAAYEAPSTPLEVYLAEAWREVLAVDRVGLRDSFFDLGGNSLQGATLINRLERHLGQHVYVTALFDTDDLGGLAAYLATHYRQRVEELFGAESLVADAGASAGATRRVDEARLAELGRLVEPLAPYPPGDTPVNPRAIFVLSPPRSGSTLLRVMLAGHDALFAPPELELLGFNTLGERRAAFADRYSFWLEGVLRAVIELRGCDADEARRLMAEREERNLSVRAFYGELQGWIGERTLVDKTPSYALDPAILERAEADFDEPLYIHLLRHPYGGILSFEEARLEQLFFRYPHGFERREIAEMIWTQSHRNILSFLEGVPGERQRVVRFEDLVRDPEPVMRDLAEMASLEYQEAMIEPYAERRRRMTDGIHEEAKMLGDVKFHTHRRIDSSTADRWREVYDEDFLGAPTRRVARTLGYLDVRPVATEATPARPLPACVTALRPGRPGDTELPPLFFVHAVFGDTYFFRHLAAELAPGRPIYGLRALGLEAGEEPAEGIEVMAERYLASIREIQPVGPVHLVGSSMGGLVAYEIARRLEADGEPAAFLAMLDTGEPGEAPKPDGDRRFEIDALHHLMGGADEATVSRVEALGTRDERLELILRLAKASGALPAAFDLARLRRLMDVVDAHGGAMVHYRPEPYGGDLVLYRAAETARWRPRPETTGWDALCAGGADLEIVPGDHMSIHFPPHVKSLAERLEARLASSRRTAGQEVALPTLVPSE